MADVNFKFNAPEANEPVYFEQIFAEKPAGGMISAPTFDIKPSTAVGAGNNGQYVVIKGYRLVEDVTADDTSIKIAKGSGIAVGDVLGYGKKGVASTAVDKSNADYDLVTISMAIAIASGEVLYQAASASASSATPKYTPLYVTGNYVEAGDGDKAVRLINGANIRKETACIGKDIAAALKNITLV